MTTEEVRAVVLEVIRRAEAGELGEPLSSMILASAAQRARKAAQASGRIGNQLAAEGSAASNSQD